jgi:hypothetical protein
MRHLAAESSVMRDLGPPPTLGELQRTTPWVWLWCERCQHHAPLACAVAVILWGPEHQVTDCVPAPAARVAAGKLRLRRPGWAGYNVGFYPFPIGNADVFTGE